MNDSKCRLFRSGAEYALLPTAFQQLKKEGVLYKKLRVILLSFFALIVVFASPSVEDLTAHTPLGLVVFLDGTS